MHCFTSFLLWTQSRTEQELFQLIFQLLDFLRIEAVVSIASSAFVSHRAPHIVFKRFCFPFFLEMGESYTAWVEIILRSCSCKVLDRVLEYSCKRNFLTLILRLRSHYDRIKI